MTKGCPVPGRPVDSCVVCEAAGDMLGAEVDPVTDSPIPSLTAAAEPNAIAGEPTLALKAPASPDGRASLSRLSRLSMVVPYEAKLGRTLCFSSV